LQLIPTSLASFELKSVTINEAQTLPIAVIALVNFGLELGISGVRLKTTVYNQSYQIKLAF